MRLNHMAKSKVTQGTRTPKKRAEKPVSEGIRRAGIRPTKSDTAPISREQIEWADRMLARAQRSAIKAAPRRIPTIGWGAAAAFDAYDDIQQVRKALAEVIGGAS